ncbi:MAG: MFS transporter [Lentisphaerae bacterium]|nr:MFS transporter [Lentisphaerota bacterium]
MVSQQHCNRGSGGSGQVDAPTPCERRNMRLATLSACWGAIPQVLVKDSGVFVIFAALIGASEMVAVLSTALQDIALCLLMLPLAALSDRIGVQRQIVLAVFAAAVAILIAAAAAWFPMMATLIMMLSLTVFAIAMSAYTSSWFPLLERIVPLSERSRFFGRMRFAWQLTSALFVFGAGWYVGHHATIGQLQLIIVVAAVLSLGRGYFISRVKMSPVVIEPMRLGAAIRDAVANRSLTGFGVYLFFLYLAANAAIPVVIVFARNYLLLSDSMVVTLSAVAMSGLIGGFLASGLIVKRMGVKGVLLVAHSGFALLNLALLCVHSSAMVSVVVLALILVLYGFIFAIASVAVSSELLELASPSNKAVSIAFGYSLYAAGLGGARALASLVLGSGILAESWSLGALEFSRYHTIFLANAVGVFMAMALLVFVPAVTRKVGRLPAM